MEDLFRSVRTMEDLFRSVRTMEDLFRCILIASGPWNICFPISMFSWLCIPKDFEYASPRLNPLFHKP